jgi:hypothetical protein
VIQATKPVPIRESPALRPDSRPVFDTWNPVGKDVVQRLCSVV